MNRGSPKVITQRLYMAIIAIAILPVVSSICLAQHPGSATNSIEVNVNAPFKVSQAVGLLLSSQGNIEKLNTTIREVENNSYIITIPLSKDDVHGDTMATAIGYSGNGDMAFAEVKPAYVPSLRKSYLSLPNCAPSAPSQASLNAVYANRGLFDSLLEIRTSRREVALVTIQGLLKGPFLEKLQKLESAFGLSRTTPLSPNLTPYELNDRLGRLLNALKGFEKTDSKDAGATKTAK